MEKRGRKKGISNKSTAELRDLARSYAPEAVEKIRWLMNNAVAEQIQLSASALLLDRGYGKSGLVTDDFASGIVGVLNVKFVKAADNDISAEVPTIIHAKQIQSG